MPTNSPLPNAIRSQHVFRLLMTLAVSGICCTHAAAESPVANSTPLFNGIDLTGWYGNDPHKTRSFATEDGRLASVAAQQEAFNKHWSVQEGVLVNDGEGPFATTNKAYGDVELTLEYKTVAMADSGIYLRGAPQVQIWDTTKAGGKWEINADKGSGGLFNNTKGKSGQLPIVHADRPFGEWNKLRILQIGAQTTVDLNGERVVDGAVMENYWDKSGKQPLAARGPIHLQTHGGEIRWRNIRVRELAAAEATQVLRGDDSEAGFISIFNGTNFDGWKGATDAFEVNDGCLRCVEGKSGVLFTDKELSDFIARVEFRLPEAGNNGLAIRYSGEGDPAYTGMTELQVLDSSAAVYERLDPRQHHGSAYGMVAASQGYLRPTGKWNYQQVTVRGSHVTVELNGTIILDADLGDVTSFLANTEHPGKDRKQGYFGFCGHDAPVEFRNIAIKHLPIRDLPPVESGAE